MKGRELTELTVLETSGQRLCSRHIGWLSIQLKVWEAVAGLTRRVKLATCVGERLPDFAKTG